MFVFQTAGEWQIVFFITSAIYLVGAVVYGIFASGERQSWAIEEQSVEGTEKSEQCYSNSALEMETT